MRNAATIIGVSGALIAGGTGIAQASQGATLDQGPRPLAQGATLGDGQIATFNTWFFGRTYVCFRNVSSEDATVDSWSGPWYWETDDVPAGAEKCPINRAFVGLPLTVLNTGEGTIQVEFKAGP